MKRWALILAMAVAASCAKVPDIAGGGSGTRLSFVMTVDREINPAFVYIVALRPSTADNPTDSGPIPVIAPPWGNGFVAGNCTHFVRYDPATNPTFLVYQFRAGSQIDYFPTGSPVVFQNVQPGDRELRFDLDLSQISADPTTLRSIQVNFLTMDRVPQGSSGTKNWDALGDGRTPTGINQWITIPLRTNGVYDNARFTNMEPATDAPDPDLEITDFRVEVRQ